VFKYDAIRDKERNLCFCARCGRVKNSYFEENHVFISKDKKAQLEYYLCFNF